MTSQVSEPKKFEYVCRWALRSGGFFPPLWWYDLNCIRKGLKKKCLKKAKIAVPRQVVFVPIDFNREPLGAALEKAGYQNHLQTLFIWEGVSPVTRDKGLVNSDWSIVPCHESLIPISRTVDKLRYLS